MVRLRADYIVHFLLYLLANWRMVTKFLFHPWGFNSFFNPFGRFCLPHLAGTQILSNVMELSVATGFCQSFQAQ